MEYLSSNLLIAYPFVDNNNLDRFPTSWIDRLSAPQSGVGDYVYGGTDSLSRLYLSYPSATASYTAALTRVANLPLDLFADIGVSANTAIDRAQLSLAHYQFFELGNSYFFYGVKVNSGTGTYYCMSAPIPKPSPTTRFTKTSGIRCLFYVDGDNWWQRVYDDSNAIVSSEGNIEIPDVSFTLKAVLSTVALARFFDYSPTGYIEVIECVTNLALEERTLFSSVGSGGVSFMLHNRTPPTPVTETVVAETWASAGAMSMPRTGHSLTVMNDGRVLATGGKPSLSGVATATAEIYDPALNTWSTAASMIKARYQHAAIKLDDGRILVIGGEPSAWSQGSSAEIFDPASDRWTLVPGTLPAQSSSALLTTTDNRVVILGGDAPGSPIYYYNVEANTFSVHGATVGSQAGARLVRLTDGTALVYFTGQGRPNNMGASYLFNPVTGVWTVVAAKAGVDYCAMAALPGNQAVSYGTKAVLPDTGSVINNLELFKEGAWHQIGVVEPLAYPRSLTSIGDQALLVGGWLPEASIEESVLATTILVDPALDPVGVTVSNSLTTGRYQHTAVALAQDRVLVTGGVYRGWTATASAEIFSLTKTRSVQASGDTITGPISGIITLENGNNVNLTAGLDEIVVATGSGFGTGSLPCPGQKNNAPMNMTVDSGGNLNIEGDDCHTIVPYAPAQTFYVFGNCESCCSCSDYANFFKALKRYGEKWVKAWDALDAVDLRYRETRRRYDLLRKNSERVTAKATGSINRGAYYSDVVGQPQWAATPTDVMTYTDLFPFTMTVNVTIHNPSPKWYATNGAYISGRNCYVYDVALDVGSRDGITLSNLKGQLAWTTGNTEDNGTPYGVSVVPTSVGTGFHFDFDFKQFSGTKLLLDPCAVLTFTITGTGQFDTSKALTTLRKITADACWKVSVTGDGNLDGLPDVADSDMEAGGKLAHATTAGVVLGIS